MSQRIVKIDDIVNGENIELMTNKTTALTSGSTDAQYPSAKTVYDADALKVDKNGTNRLVTTAEVSTWSGKQDALGFTPENAANKNANNGYAPLDAGGKVPTANLPNTLLKYKSLWNPVTNTPTLADIQPTQAGEVYIASDAGTRFSIVWKSGDWLVYNDSGVIEISPNSDEVVSVAGQVGIVTLAKSDVGLGNVDNTADVNKTVAKSNNLIGGNGTTLLGSIPYQSNTDITTQLAPNVTTTKKFLRSIGDATNGTAPAWDTIADGDIANSIVTGKLITGFVSGAGVVATTDSILQVINKLDGNIALKAPITSPIFLTDLTTPLIIGGSAVGSNITYKSTTGAGTLTGIAHKWTGGTNGATVLATMLNNGNVGLGTSTPNAKLEIVGASQSSTDRSTHFELSTGTGVLTDSKLVFGIHDDDYAWIQSVKQATGYRNLALNPGGGGVSIGANNPASGAKLDIAFGGISLLIGANSSAVTRTDATQKFGRIGSAHYTNAEEPVAMFLANADASANILNIGGGTSVMNAVTQIKFHAAANSTTLAGTEVAQFTLTGLGLKTLAAPTAFLHLGAGTATASTAPLKFTSQAIGTLLTTTEPGVCEFSVDSFFGTITTGAVRRLFVMSQTGRATAQTAANASIQTYTLGAVDASFEVSANVLVTTSSAENFTVTVAYTDEGNTARTLTLPFITLAGASVAIINFANGAVPYEGLGLHIRVKASTTITVATTGTFTGATYNVESIIKKI